MTTTAAPEQTTGPSRSRGRRRGPDPEQAPAPVVPPVAVRGVNLLSPWVLREIRVRRIRKQLAHGLVALLVLVAGAWTFQQLRLSAARSELRGEVAVGEGLQVQIGELAPVTEYVASVRQRADSVRTTMATQIGQADVMHALARATPADTALESVAFALPVPGVPLDDTTVQPSAADLEATRGIVASCPGPDPFGARQVVACVMVSGTAPDRQSVSALVRRLAANSLFVEPFVDTTTTEEGVVTFTGSVGLSPEAFTERYDAVEPARVETGAEVAR